MSDIPAHARHTSAMGEDDETHDSVSRAASWSQVITLSLTEITSWGILYYTFSLLLGPMEHDLHWNQASLTGAYSLALLVSGLMAVPIGRWLDRTRQTIHQPLYRQFFGRCFNWITRTVMGLPFRDTQCGFKAFRREAAQVIFRLQTIERWGFDPEILFIARKLKYEIREVPVTWGHDERSRISYLKDGMKMLEEMARIRANSLAGRYDEAIAAMRDTSTMVTRPVESGAKVRAGN